MKVFRYRKSNFLKFVDTYILLRVLKCHGTLNPAISLLFHVERSSRDCCHVSIGLSSSRKGWKCVVTPIPPKWMHSANFKRHESVKVYIKIILFEAGVLKSVREIMDVPKLYHIWRILTVSLWMLWLRHEGITVPFDDSVFKSHRDWSKPLFSNDAILLNHIIFHIFFSRQRSSLSNRWLQM